MFRIIKKDYIIRPLCQIFQSPKKRFALKKCRRRFTLLKISWISLQVLSDFSNYRMDGSRIEISFGNWKCEKTIHVFSAWIEPNTQKRTILSTVSSQVLLCLISTANIWEEKRNSKRFGIKIHFRYSVFCSIFEILYNISYVRPVFSLQVCRSFLSSYI